jgi:serine/threonine protein kinase
MFRENSQIGPYTLIRKLGRGGFGEVWLAERRAKFVTTKVAVKLPLEEQVDPEAIKQEATLWEQASGHPNVLPIIDADEYDGQIVIVSEYAPDGSLEHQLRQNGPMTVGHASYLMIDILAGLEFLHLRRIIHRDLKPANILLQGETPRLSDFGISRALRIGASSDSQNVSGTFTYMAPEAFDGKRSVQTDIWSAGVNFYRFLTGKFPYPQKEPTALIAAIMMQEAEPLPHEVPKEVRQIIAKAMAKKPEDRYTSAGEMREDLRKLAYEKFDRRKTPREPVMPPVDPEEISEKTVVSGVQPITHSVEQRELFTNYSVSGRGSFVRTFFLLIIGILSLLGLGFAIIYYGPARLTGNSNVPGAPPTNSSNRANSTGNSPGGKTSNGSRNSREPNSSPQNATTNPGTFSGIAPSSGAPVPPANSAQGNAFVDMNEPDVRDTRNTQLDDPDIHVRPVNSRKNNSNSNKKP